MAPQCGREEYIAVLAGKEWQLTGYAWEDTPMLWSQVPGEACSVWTIWKGKDWEHLGWKVNPETPWTRTPLGFDTTDHVLDVMVGPDLTSWKWKDEDEFSEAVGLELFSAAEAAAIRTEARRAHGELVGRGQRKAKEWAAWRPGRDWTIPALSPGWEEV